MLRSPLPRRIAPGWMIIATGGHLRPRGSPTAETRPRRDGSRSSAAWRNNAELISSNGERTICAEPRSSSAMPTTTTTPQRLHTTPTITPSRHTWLRYSKALRPCRISSTRVLQPAAPRLLPRRLRRGSGWSILPHRTRLPSTSLSVQRVRWTWMRIMTIAARRIKSLALVRAPRQGSRRMPLRPVQA